MMNELNQIWKAGTGRDLTTDEAWKMVSLVGMILENADKNLDNAIAEAHKNWEDAERRFFLDESDETEVNGFRTELERLGYDMTKLDEEESQIAEKILPWWDLA